jgi:hypothetical protein
MKEEQLELPLEYSTPKISEVVRSGFEQALLDEIERSRARIKSLNDDLEALTFLSRLASGETPWIPSPSADIAVDEAQVFDKDLLAKDLAEAMVETVQEVSQLALDAIENAYEDDEDLDEDYDEQDEDETTEAVWDSYFDRETLAISFRLPYSTEDGDGVTKVEYEEATDSWYFHDTFYDSLDALVSIHTSNFLFRQPGAALNAACEWLEENR